jgi:hypothetical protein
VEVPIVPPGVGGDGIDVTQPNGDWQYDTDGNKIYDVADDLNGDGKSTIDDEKYRPNGNWQYDTNNDGIYDPADDTNKDGKSDKNDAATDINPPWNVDVNGDGKYDDADDLNGDGKSDSADTAIKESGIPEGFARIIIMNAHTEAQPWWLA